MTGPCSTCPAIGQLWPHAGRMQCDRCLTAHEEARARELPPGEERPARTWASWETRPITQAEATRRVRHWGARGVAAVDSLINAKIAAHDRKGAGQPGKRAAIAGAIRLREAMPARAKRKPDAPLRGK